uniref:Uncharacterized protein n=1 Tax=Anguilla anguilla TaxID=7936 RepID=A0A0E9SRH5_ANGAN
MFLSNQPQLPVSLQLLSASTNTTTAILGHPSCVLNEEFLIVTWRISKKKNIAMQTQRPKRAFLSSVKIYTDLSAEGLISYQGGSKSIWTE